MSARGSVRRRLIIVLLAGTALVWLAATIATVIGADHEMEEVFDAHLAQTATILALRVDDEDAVVDTEHSPFAHKYAKALSFQVWKHGRTLQLHSSDSSHKRFSARDEGFSTETIAGRRWRVFSLWDKERKHLVQVRNAIEDRNDVTLEIVAALATPVAVAMPLLALLAWLAVGSAFKPLARVSDEISRRDPKHLAPLEGDVPDEIAPLVARLNALLARVQSSLDGERRFTSDAAHELRTPLAALRAQLQVAQGATDAAERERAVASALVAGERATRVVEQLLTLARLEHGAWRAAAAPFDLHAVAAESIAERAALAHAKRIEISLEGGAGVMATGHALLAAIAVGNLIDNALRYSPPDTAVTVDVAMRGDRAVVSVRDEGPGIPAGKRNDALRRFTRLEGSGEDGSGLGLSIVTRIAELHGATLQLGDGPGGRGLEATLRFPVA